LSKHKSQQLEWPGKSILNMREIEKIQKHNTIIAGGAAELTKQKPPLGQAKNYKVYEFSEQEFYKNLNDQSKNPPKMKKSTEFI